MRRVRCPRCLAIVLADGQSVTCRACGLSGRVETAVTAPAKEGRRQRRQDRRGARQPAAAARPAASGAAAAGGAAAGAAATAPSAADPHASHRRDPWTITIDLRNLMPSRWSPGAKAFSTLFMLAFVFFAGGVSGVVFERTRSEVVEDLDQGLFGSQDRQAGSPGQGATQGPQAPADEGSNEPDAGADPDDGATDPDPPDDGQVDPGTDQVFSGAGTWTSPAFSLPSGLVRFTMSHHGTDGSFSAKLVRQNATGAPAASASASDFGQFNQMVRYDGPLTAGSYHLAVTAPGGGTWEVDVGIVGDEAAGSGSFALQDHGDAGLGPFRFNGDMEVTFESGTTFSFDVKAFRQDGSPIPGCTLRGDDAKSGSCSFSSETKVYFDIQTPSGDTKWKFTASNVE